MLINQLRLLVPNGLVESASQGLDGIAMVMQIAVVRKAASAITFVALMAYTAVQLQLQWEEIMSIATFIGYLYLIISFSNYAFLRIMFGRGLFDEVPRLESPDGLQPDSPVDKTGRLSFALPLTLTESGKPALSVSGLVVPPSDQTPSTPPAELPDDIKEIPRSVPASQQSSWTIIVVFRRLASFPRRIASRASFPRKRIHEPPASIPTASEVADEPFSPLVPEGDLKRPVSAAVVESPLLQGELDERGADTGPLSDPFSDRPSIIEVNQQAFEGALPKTFETYGAELFPPKPLASVVADWETQSELVESIGHVDHQPGLSSNSLAYENRTYIVISTAILLISVGVCLLMGLFLSLRMNPQARLTRILRKHPSTFSIKIYND